MKRILSFFSLLLIAAVQMWASLPTPKVEYVQLYENGPMWATMNLGATSVTDAGKYFWWGDVVGHAEDEAFNFNYDNTAITSYGNNEGYVADGKLVAEKDAATQQLGAGYRMPTQAEFEDLYNKCTWTWQSNGYLITGKGEYSGNSIFLPAAGYRFEESIAGVDLFGGYYPSTPISNDAYAMSILYFNSDGINYDEKIYRCYGFPVRPIYDAQAAYDYFASLMGDYIYSGNGVKFFVSEGQLMITIGENQPEPLASIMDYFSKEWDGYHCVITGDEYVFYIENGELTRIGVKTGSQVSFYLDKRSTVPFAQITIGENVTDYYNAEEFCLELASIEGTVTVKLLSDMTLSGYDDISNWQETANVTLDLNGHNIKGNVDGCLVGSRGCKFTIVGEGTVENNAEEFGFAISSEGSLVVNSGTYKSTFAICYVYVGCELIINGGKFNAPALYAIADLDVHTKPIVKGGLFSMDPTDSVAEGYEVVANNDEATKAEYPYKVVEKSLVPTAIEGVDAPAAQKAVKTIENGKVVIIRNGERYDIAGRRL